MTPEQEEEQTHGHFLSNFQRYDETNTGGFTKDEREAAHEEIRTLSEGPEREGTIADFCLIATETEARCNGPRAEKTPWPSPDAPAGKKLDQVKVGTYRSQTYPKWHEVALKTLKESDLFSKPVPAGKEAVYARAKTYLLELIKHCRKLQADDTRFDDGMPKGERHTKNRIVWNETWERVDPFPPQPTAKALKKRETTKRKRDEAEAAAKETGGEAAADPE